jgi:CRP-like cAMP-binding protein
MSRNDIADFLGLATETVSRTISNLRRNDIISTETGRKISITHMETLSALADCA